MYQAFIKHQIIVHTEHLVKNFTGNRLTWHGTRSGTENNFSSNLNFPTLKEHFRKNNMTKEEHKVFDRAVKSLESKPINRHTLKVALIMAFVEECKAKNIEPVMRTEEERDNAIHCMAEYIENTFLNTPEIATFLNKANN